MSINYTNAYTAIAAKLSGLSLFENVYKGDRGRIGPRLAPGGAYATFWWAGRDPTEMTLGNVIAQELFAVRCYWPVAIEEEAILTQEIALATYTQAIHAAFSTDRDLGGVCESLYIGVTDAGWVPADAAPTHRVIEFELRLQDTEAEAVSK